MSDAGNAVNALKNAWNGAVKTADALRELAPSVQALPESAGLEGVDLDAYHRVAAAQGLAVMALRGLVEDLQRLREKELA